MNYEETVEFLYQQLPIFQRQGAAAYKKDLGNTQKLLKALQNPERQFKSIHIAGTNGKGSVCHMLAAVYQTAGYKVGLHTSPHLLDFRERIKCNNQLVPKFYVTQFVQENIALIRQIQPSFFELTVAMAFRYFADENVDIAIIETGMGGRLDSTNVLQPLVAGITNIGFDHMQFLGDTLGKIASEKAGIIKAHTPVVIGRFQEECHPVYQQKARSLEAPLHYASEVVTHFPSDPSWPAYLVENAQMAAALLKVAQNRVPVTQQQLHKGILHFSSISGLMGRWQQLHAQPRVIVDAAHNADGLQQVQKQLEKLSFANLHIVYGTVSDKDLSKVAPYLPSTATYYFCAAEIPRALPVDTLHAYLTKEGFNGHAYSSCEKAYTTAFDNAKDNDLVLVIGSIFVLAEVLAFHQSDVQRSY